MKTRHLFLIFTCAVAMSGLAIAQQAPPSPQPETPQQPPEQPPQDEQAPQPNNRITPEARQVLEAMGDAYSKLENLKLEGVVTTELHIGEQQQKTEQKFTASYKAPNMFRHDFDDQVTVGSTGEDHFVYSKGDNAFLRTPIDPDQSLAEQLPQPVAQILQSQNPSLLLAIQRDALKNISEADVNVRKVDDVEVDGKAFTALELHGEDDSPRVILLIDPQTHLIRRLSTDIKPALEAGGAEDVQTAKFSIDYSEVDPKAELQKAQFAWTPPEGARDMAEVVADEPQANQLIGEPAPDFTLTTLEGKQMKLADLRGKPVLIDFWATWCPPCVESLPHLSQLHQDRKDNVHVYAINLREETDKVRGFLQQHKLTMPVLLDAEGKVAQLYGVRSIPQTVLIDKEGVVRQVYVGYGPDTIARIKHDLDALQNGQAPAAVEERAE